MPGVIKRGIADWLGPWLDAEGLTIDEVPGWAVRPGGRDVLEGVRRGLQLDPALMAPSIEVLDRRGNMSSGTILWVLDRVLASPPGDRCSPSFGPGLTGEASCCAGERPPRRGRADPDPDHADPTGGLALNR